MVCMPSIPVDLPKNVSGESLLEACLRAASDVGLKTGKLEDDFNQRYSISPSVQEHKEDESVRIPISTPIPPKKLFGFTIFPGYDTPAFMAVGVKKQGEQKRFFLWTGDVHGSASDEKIHAYLDALAKYLPSD
jgi:hypothetical protein